LIVCCVEIVRTMNSVQKFWEGFEKALEFLVDLPGRSLLQAVSLEDQSEFSNQCQPTPFKRWIKSILGFICKSSGVSLGSLLQAVSVINGQVGIL
jgi:hypothetical protein